MMVSEFTLVYYNTDILYEIVCSYNRPVWKWARLNSLTIILVDCMNSMHVHTINQYDSEWITHYHTDIGCNTNVIVLNLSITVAPLFYCVTVLALL